MSNKQNSGRVSGDAPAEVFRQFAWHLAGSLAAARTQGNTGRAGKAAGKGTGKR